MKRNLIILSALLFLLSSILASQIVIERREMTRDGIPVGQGYGTAVPTLANDGRNPVDGELFVVRTSGSDALLHVYNESTTSWDTTPMLQNTNTWTVANTFNGNVTLGDTEDDTITVNGPVTYRVQREDFEGPYLTIDFTNGDFVQSVADDEMNMLLFPNMLIAYEHEVAFGGSATASTFINHGIDAATDAVGRVWLVDDATMVDATGDDAVEFVFGGTEIDAVLFIEEATDSLDAYCEVEIRLDDISDLTDADFYFGFMLDTAIDDTFGWESNNTYATYHIDDNAGNLVISTSLNGGSDLEEDSTVVGTWADNETHVLRVEMGADAVVFITDGTAETQATAVLNADATDSFVCRMGFQFAAGKVGLELNYVEIGKEQ